MSAIRRASAPIILLAASLITAIFIFFELANNFLVPIGIMIAGSLAARWAASPEESETRDEKEERERRQAGQKTATSSRRRLSK